MKVASLALCEELYKLSGWDDTGLVICQSGSYREGYGPDSDKGWFAYGENEAVRHHQDKFPKYRAYDLGYLLRKLPYGFTIVTRFNDGWMASWAQTAQAPDIAVEGDTPEDAVAVLTLELFGRGIMTDHSSTEQPAE